MIKELKKTSNILSIKEKKRLVYLFILKFFAGIMDMVGVASVIPFIAVIINEKILNENLIVLNIKEFFNYNNQEIIIMFAILSLSLIIFNHFIRLLTVWYDNYVNLNIAYSLTALLFQFYLNQPYNFHIKESSTKLLEKVSVQTNKVVIGVISPFCQILGNVFTLLFLVLLLFLTDPVVAIVLLILIGVFYSSIFIRIKKRISNYGEFGNAFIGKSLKLIDQGFRSIKDIKIKNNVNFYMDLFNPLCKKAANTYVKLGFISAFPKSVLEIFVYTFGFSLIIYFLLLQAHQFQEIIIIISVYAIALQKLLPAAQSIYQQVLAFRFHKPSFYLIYNDLVSAVKESKSLQMSSLKKVNCNFNKEIELKNIKFKYPDSEKNVLNVNYLKIEAGSSIGITGKTGSGKSTFIDLIIGLLEPISGEISIDGKKLDHNLIESWQSKIGYVPQFSFMADDTIKNNIALGIKQHKIDNNRIQKVCELANISSFINGLQFKYETRIGADGVKLSGGQRQRISIARALYKNPSIIVFDEATNSLDSATEKLIVNSLLKEGENKTLIMVAHRLSVLKSCDEILFISNEHIADRGTYDNLTKNNNNFGILVDEITKDKKNG